MDGRKAVESTFKALFALTEIRFVLRGLRPGFEPGNGEKKRLKKLIAKAREEIDKLEGSI